MSMQPHESRHVPEETKRIARAAFPKGNLYIRLHDELGELYDDSLFAALFSGRGQPAESPGRLALITVLQFAEGLSDRQAADAVRARIDWKYALALELTDPGFDYSVLSEFRQRLVENQKMQELLDVLLRELKERGLLKERGRARTDSTHVLAAVRILNRLELVGETMRRALNELAEADPDWLRSVAKLEWYTRYGQRFDSIRLPKGKAERDKLVETIGEDGLYLLHTVYATDAMHVPPAISTTDAINDTPAKKVEAVSTSTGQEGSRQLRWLGGVEMLRRIWVQQFWVENREDYDPHSGRSQHSQPGQGQPSSRIRLRADDNQPPGEKRLHSPYDADARYSAKRGTEWLGYKVHITETCDDDQIHVITNVETTTAVVQDVSMPGKVHEALADKKLLPSEHLMDAGFVAADGVVEAQRDYGIEVIGPVKKDVRWQANTEGGYDLSQFHIDWGTRTVTCPQGQQAGMGPEHLNSYNKAVIEVKFKTSLCRSCSARALCTRAKREGRLLLIRPQAQHTALQRIRGEVETAEFRKRYTKRSGIEGTISEGVRAHDMRRTRYIGLGKTHLQMVAAATAINLHRLYDWLTETPRSLTRISPFASLAPDQSLVPMGWRAA